MIEKYWDGHGGKCVWLLFSQDFKIGCVSRRNEWNKLIFDVLMQIQESYFNNSLVVVVKNGHGLLGLGTQKSAV